eukprot:8967039-Alexandrium_andersonii.AAC.1
MSASLVGSEMCIRDRTKVLHFLNRVEQTSVADFAVNWRSFEYLRNPVSVSYTHLTLPTICSV